MRAEANLDVEVIGCASSVSEEVLAATLRRFSEDALVALTGRVLIAFVVVSALSALLDEKGVGRGLGMNSGSKHIQQVQDSVNVSFDDVKGVEEAKVRAIFLNFHVLWHFFLTLSKSPSCKKSLCI